MQTLALQAHQTSSCMCLSYRFIYFLEREDSERESKGGAEGEERENPYADSQNERRMLCKAPFQDREIMS